MKTKPNSFISLQINKMRENPNSQEGIDTSGAEIMKRARNKVAGVLMTVSTIFGGTAAVATYSGCEQDDPIENPNNNNDLTKVSADLIRFRAELTSEAIEKFSGKLIRVIFTKENGEEVKINLRTPYSSDGYGFSDTKNIMGEKIKVLSYIDEDEDDVKDSDEISEEDKFIITDDDMLNK